MIDIIVTVTSLIQINVTVTNAIPINVVVDQYAPIISGGSNTNYNLVIAYAVAL